MRSFQVIFWCLTTLPVFTSLVFCQTDLSEDSVYTYAEAMPLYLSPECDHKGPLDYEQCSSMALIQAMTKVEIPNSVDAEDILPNSKLIISFVVEKDGNTSHVAVVQSIHPHIDAKYVEFFKRSKWIPGRKSGKNVRVKYSVPAFIKFE